MFAVNAAAAGCLAAAGVFATAWADTIPVVGLTQSSTEMLGDFSGSVTYTPTGPTTGELTVFLVNETAPDTGGFLTGFLFKIVSLDPNASATLVSSDYPAFENASGSAPPYGDGFEGGAALGGNWTGGGNPSGGIPVGGEGTFVFSVTASDAEDLTAARFVNGNGSGFGFVVRFRGMDNGGSDKEPAGALICCIGDVDCDGDVDGRDLGFLLAAWGPNPGSSADFTGDGIVDGADLGLLLSNWGLCP